LQLVYLSISALHANAWAIAIRTTLRHPALFRKAIKAINFLSHPISVAFVTPSARVGEIPQACGAKSAGASFAANSGRTCRSVA
jgi:hypothetical protein